MWTRTLSNTRTSTNRFSLVLSSSTQFTGTVTQACVSSSLAAKVTQRLPGVRFWTGQSGLYSFEPDCPVLGRLVLLKISAQTRHRYTDIIHLYTDPDRQFLAPTQNLEVGQECPVFSTWRPGNPTHIYDVISVTITALCLKYQLNTDLKKKNNLCRKDQLIHAASIVSNNTNLIPTLNTAPQRYSCRVKIQTCLK